MSVLHNPVVQWVFPFQNNPKNVDQSYKIDLEFRGCFGGKSLCLIAE